MAQAHSAHDIDKLKQGVSSLDSAISQLHDAKHAERLLTIIHRPGWTTLPEFQLVQAHVAALSEHVRNVHKGFDALVNIADKIGTSK